MRSRLRSIGLEMSGRSLDGLRRVRVTMGLTTAAFRRAGSVTHVAILISWLAASMRLSAFATASVTLAWQPSTDPNIAGYNIYYGVASHSYIAKISVGNATRATISGLVAGTTYFFAATAYNTSGLESVPSVEMSYTVPTPPSGTYNGLFHENDERRLESTGILTLSVAAGGSYSASLKIRNSHYSISGRLGPQFQATHVITPRNANPLTVQFQIGTGVKADQISGYVSDGTWMAPLLGYRAVSSSRTQPAPYAGNYTLIIPGSDFDPSAAAGDGFGTVLVNSSGVVRFAGALADGTPVSQAVVLSRNGLWPLYIPLYGGKGMVTSWMGFTNQANSDLSGQLSWIRISGAWARSYPGGFTNECGVLGSVYISTNSILDLTNASVIISGDHLTSSFTNSVTLGPSGRILNSDSNRLSLNISRSSGTFKGIAADPYTGSLLSFRGAILQKLNAGCGYLLGADQNGRVLITP